MKDNKTINKLCPLCTSKDNTLFSKDKRRAYYRCNRCNLIFVPNIYHLSETDEKERYNLHTNNSLDPKYREFLSRIINPVKKHISNNAKGLDFGCGPGPILKSEFIKSNIILKEYDLYFKNDRTLLEKQWDFIITTEVIEHLKEPLIVLESLWGIINKNGILAIMTSLYNESIEFKSWYYKGDPTHICFYSKETFNWISNYLNCKIEFFDKDIIILKKN